jgi:hypothetical protein
MITPSPGRHPGDADHFRKGTLGGEGIIRLENPSLDGIEEYFPDLKVQRCLIKGVDLQGLRKAVDSLASTFRFRHHPSSLLSKLPTIPV